jgi:uncharacterized membrane protein SirB2
MLAKTIHVGCALLSISLFFIRGLWMISDSPWRRKPAVKILPHIVDTTLLVSAIVLVVQTAQYPLEQSWLLAKISALLVYIGLGLVALRFGSSKPIRIVAWLCAILTFMYIYSVAITRNPMPFIG